MIKNKKANSRFDFFSNWKNILKSKRSQEGSTTTNDEWMRLLIFAIVFLVVGAGLYIVLRKLIS